MTRRPLFVVSLVFAALTAALWALSYATHWVGTSAPWSAGLRHGKLKIMYFGETAPPTSAAKADRFAWAGMWIEHEVHLQQAIRARNPFTGTAPVSAKYLRLVHVLVPLWMPMAIFSAWPLIVLVLRGPLLRRYRWRHGLCLRCGYNLTGNVSLKCPECGTDVASAPPTLSAQ